MLDIWEIALDAYRVDTDNSVGNSATSVVKEAPVNKVMEDVTESALMVNLARIACSNAVLALAVRRVRDRVRYVRMVDSGTNAPSTAAHVVCLRRLAELCLVNWALVYVTLVHVLLDIGA